MFWFKKKNKYNVLPNIGRSYVVGQNGEPMLTFYRPNSGLFCNAPLSDKDTPYFLNIRAPVVITQVDAILFGTKYTSISLVLFQCL